MLAPALLAVLLAAEPAASTPSLAAPGLTAVNVDEKEGAFYSEHLAQQMLLSGVRVVTASEISALLGFERQKALLGCTENSASCMAELGAALGVDGLLMGSVGRFGNAYQLNVKVVSTRDGRVLTAYSERLGSGDEVLDGLSRAAKKMAGDLGGKPAPSEAVSSAAPPSSSGGSTPVWPFIAGGGLMVPGIAGIIVASGYAGALREGVENGQPIGLTRASELRDTGRLFEYGGYGLSAVGLGLIGYGTYRALSGDAPAVSAAVVSDGRSFQFALGGTF